MSLIFPPPSRLSLTSTQRSYQLLPFRFARIPGIEDVLIVNEVGEHLFVRYDDLADLVNGNLNPDKSVYPDLKARHFLFEGDSFKQTELWAAKYRTKKSFLRDGPALHIFVLTLRCHHSCMYCQVSRQNVQANAYDMSRESAAHAIDRVFESASPVLTIEFQGGEPTLAFGLLQSIVEAVLERNISEKRDIRFVLTTTMDLLTDGQLRFLKEHNFHISTSLDGPRSLHNANRPLPSRDSYERTIEALARVRDVMGHDRVSALTTLSRASLGREKEIIDTYVEHQFSSIFLRPLSLYGFAARNSARLDYSAEEFLQSFARALDYLLEINMGGYFLEEGTAQLVLNNILTPYSHGYVDLRSPVGAGLGVLVYNYDGGVYASDESRMLQEMNQPIFRMGDVSQSLGQLMTSDAMQLLLKSGVAESLPGCSDCAFLPFCGADPVDTYARYGDPVGHKPSTNFCRKQTGLFNYFFKKLHDSDPATMRVFLSWLKKVPYSEIGSRNDFGGTRRC